MSNPWRGGKDYCYYYDYGLTTLFLVAVVGFSSSFWLLSFISLSLPLAVQVTIADRARWSFSWGMSNIPQTDALEIIITSLHTLYKAYICTYLERTAGFANLRCYWQRESPILYHCPFSPFPPQHLNMAKLLRLALPSMLQQRQR